MKTLLYLLLLCAAIRLTQSACPTATVEMHRLEQSGDEGDPITLNFNLGCELDEAIYSIDLTYTDVEASATTDFSGPTTVDIPTGVLFFSTMLTLVDDDIVEIDETFLVEVESIGSTASPTGTVSIILGTTQLTTTVTIEDDDTVTVSIAPSLIQLQEMDGSTDPTATLTLEWFGLVDLPSFTVGVAYNADTTEDSDLTTGATSYELSLGTTNSITIPIVISSDDIVEEHESLTVSLTDVGYPNDFGRTDGIFLHSESVTSVVEILDDDTISVEFSADQSADEGNSVLVLFLFSNQVEDAGFSFSFSIPDTNVEAIDYNFIPSLQTVDIPTLTPDLTYTVLYTDDAKAEDDETVSFSINQVFSPLTTRNDAAEIGSKSTFEGTIEDDDDAIIKLSPTSMTLLESVGSYTQTILIDPQLEDEGYSITLTTIDNAADYNLATQIHAIPACVASFEVAVNILDDDVVEDCETFSVSLSAVSVPSGFRSDVISLSDRTATVTIEDQDTATIGIQSIGTFTESDGLGTITLSLTVPTGGFADSGYSATVTITDGNTDGTADILTSYFEFELPQSAATAEVAVGLADNALFEDYESFTASIITVTPPTGYKRSGAGDTVIINSVENGISGVIEDDDNAVISFQSATLSGTENSNVIVTMVSDTAFEDAGFSISIDYNDAGDFDSAGMFADYSPVLTSTIPTATTTFSFLLSVSGDSWVEDTESVTLSFDSLIYPGTYSRGTGASFSTPSSTTEVQISDDDSAVVGLTTASLPVTEGDGADVTSTVTFSLDNTVLVSGFVIDLSWDDLTAIDGSDAYDDYNSGPSTVEIPTGTLVGTFLFEVPSNEIVEDHESFSISLTGITNPTLTRVDDPVTVGSSSSATVVIEDDDTATLCFDTSVNTVTEGVSSVTNTLSLTVDSEIEDSITVALTFNTGTAAGQFTNAETGETVDIPTDGPAGTSHPISVLSDMKIEDHQTFTAILGARTNADTDYNRDPDDAVVFEATCSSLAVTILDDDTATIEMDLRDIEGGEEDGNVIINVDISGGVLCTEGFSATLSYDDITATGGSDYANTNVHIPIPTYTGTSDQFNFLLTFTSDQIVEDHERFNVILTEVGALPAFSRTDFIVVTDVAIDQSTSVTIIDDDSATLTVVSDTACHAEDDGTATVTLTLDNQVEDEGFKFGVTYSDIDASVSTDFIGTVTLGDFATLTNLFSFTVSLVDDEVVEFEQSFSLSLAPVSIPTSFIRSEPFVYLHATSRTATVTIKDDDTATVSLSSKVTALESSGLAEVVVFLSNPIEDPTSFSATFTYSDKTVTGSSDYTPGPSSAMFPSDPATELTIAVSIRDDNVVEDLESFCVLLTGVSDPLTSNSLLIAPGEESTTVCITDDDTATVGISVTSSVVEDDTTLTVTLAYSGGTIADSGFTAEISYTGDAEAGSDYNQVTEHIIPPNSASSEFDLVIVEDDVVESDEKAILELFNIQHPFTSRTSGAVVVFPIPSSATQTVTIVNDDTATCTLSSTSVCVTEGDGTIDIELVCSNPVQDDGFTIGILYEEDSALDVNDYTGTLDTVPFPTAETTFSFSVELVDDEIVEDTQSFIVRTPSADDERLLVLTSTLTVTIKDDDTVTCSLLTTDESSDENTGPVPIEVLCDLQVEEEGFSLDIGYSPKSAGTPSDFGTTVITVPVPTATTTVAFNVGIVNDEIVEDIESFCVTLDGIDLPGGFTRTVGAEITPSTATVTISDDDTAICSLDQTAVCVEEGVNDHATITVSCDKVIQDGGVDVDLVYRDADAFNPGDYIDAPQQVNLPVGSTTTEFQVSIVDDSEIESSESFEILLVRVADTAGFTRLDAVELGDQTTTVTIKNDDSVTCSFATSEVTVDEFDGFLSVEVECNGVHAKDGVSFEFDYTEGTATQPDDFDSIVTTIGFPSSTTSLSFSISIVPDEIVEKDHSFTISLSNVILPEGVDENCISFMGSQVVTILDDDTATCRFDPTEDCVTEGTSPFIASVTCDLQVDCPGITFDVDLSDGTAVETSDYTTNDGTFSFDINTNDLSFEVGIADDSNVENHQSFTVGVSGVNFPDGFDDTAAVQFVGTQIVTIKDDDTTTCSLDPALHDVDESQSGTVTIVCDNQVDDEGVSLNLCFTDGTAEDGVDYVSTDPFPFPTGTTTFSVELEIVDDTIIEGDETFDVEICDFSFEPGFSATTAFEVTGSAQCQIDDDDFADCSFTPVSQCLFEEDGFFTISIACSKATDVAGFEIGIQGFDLDAESTSDYVVPSPRIEIPVETLEFTTLIEIVDDNEQEEDEEFYVMFGSTFQPERFPRTGVFSLLPPVTFTLTIKDNDVATTQSPLTTMGSTAPSEETTQATTEQTTTSKPEQPTTDQTTDQTTPADYHTQEQQDRNLPFEPQPCQLECLGQHMECMAVEGIATCNCTDGYELVNAEVCQDQNECALSPCSGGVYEMCINTDGSYFCECNEGYGRSVSGDCEDNDECLVSPCLDYQDCVNLDGGFSCVCRDGFLTTADDICVDIDECSTGVDDCHLFTNTLCKNTIGHFVCACVDGFVRNPSGACSLLEECEPDFKETCQFPEEFCYVNELRENFCGCSPGYDRLSPSSQCENRDECLDVPDVCRSVENSHCVDEIPSVDDPNRFYVCECTEGYREIVTGICMKEIQLRLGMVITEVNNERALNLWSEELTDTDSQRFQQFSEFLCSFFHESVLSSPDVNQTSCRGLGFAEDATGMYVALELTVVPTSNGEAATADKIKESLLQDANFEGEGVYIWEKSNRDSITVQTTSLDVQALEDIGCSRSLCQNGGTCVFDENVYRTACSCPDGFEGEVCQNEITQNEVDSRPPEETTAPSSIGLLIGVTIGAVIFALVMIGLCCLLLRTPNKDAGRKQSAFTEVPLRLTARPLGIRDPSVIRNPLATRHLKPGSHANDDDDYDDLRMRRLETSFVKMGSPRSNASHSTSDSDDDGSSTTSPEFTLPYAADGSVNV